MSADESVEIPIHLRQNVDTEAAKAAAGLKGLAAGFGAASDAGTKLAAVKMPAIVKDGAALKMLGREAAEAAAQLSKMAAAKESAERAGAAAFAKSEKAAESERKQKLAIGLAVKASNDKIAASEAKVRAESDKSRGGREAAAMSAGLAALKAASKEADAIRAHEDAADARRAKAKAKIADAAYEKAVAAANKMPASMQPKAAAPVVSSFQKLLGEVESVFGKKAAGATAGAAQGLAKIGENYEKMGPIGQSLIKGGGAIAIGAAALAAASAGLLIAGAIKIGQVALEQSELKKATVAAFDRLSNGAGAESYKIALKLSADLNLDEGDAVAQVKGLLQAKVDKSVIPLVVTAAADIKIAKGDEAANALTKGIEKISNKGKFGTEAIDSLAEAGVNAADVYAALAKKGESVASVMARVKTNQVGAAEGIRAVLAAVEKTSGGLAKASGQSLAGLGASIQKSFLHLFDDVDTGPLKETLATVKALFDGEKGTKLKASVTELGNAIFGIFKGLNTPEGKKALSDGFDKAAEAASNAAVVMRALDRGVTALGSNGGFQVLAAAADALLAPLQQAAAIIKVISVLSGGDEKSTGGTTSPAVTSSFDTSAAAASANGAGGDIAGGLASGVTAGGPEIAAAVTQAANDAVRAAKVALGIASPSKVFAGIGRYGALGLAKGMNDNAGVVADAGASMASASVGGAAGAMGSAAGSSGGGGSAPVQINITINPAAGSTAAQVGAMSAAATDAAHAAWLQSERRATRDRGERSAA